MYTFNTYLFIKFINNAFCPFQMQLSNFCWTIDICQFDAYLTDKQPIIFIAPFYTMTVDIISLGWAYTFWKIKLKLLMSILFLGSAPRHLHYFFYRRFFFFFNFNVVKKVIFCLWNEIGLGSTVGLQGQSGSLQTNIKFSLWRK